MLVRKPFRPIFPENSTRCILIFIIAPLEKNSAKWHRGITATAGWLSAYYATLTSSINVLYGLINDDIMSYIK